MAVVAFIPVRGGSKSIPLKNIKLLNGKPLIYWSAKSCNDCQAIDRVVIATDNTQIENTVIDFRLTKVEIYRRSPKNAQDASTTESVMLEYIKSRGLSDDDTFILVQATSPFTKSIHLDEALVKYSSENHDSLLSVCRSKRFYWNESGTPINYDYKSRPRRQDFQGQLLENGAFYINRVQNIVAEENRLSGEIGFYIMPEYSSLELDEPDDWITAEQLMNKKGYT